MNNTWFIHVLGLEVFAVVFLKPLCNKLGSTIYFFFAFCVYIRKYLPRRLLTVSNCGSFGAEDYCELGSRFKAQHIKVMTWWVAYKLGKITQDSVTCLNLEKARV